MSLILDDIVNISLAFFLLLILAVIGVFITLASIELGAYRRKKKIDQELNQAAWYAFYGAVFTDTIFGLIAATALIGGIIFVLFEIFGGGEAEAIAGVGAGVGEAGLLAAEGTVEAVEATATVAEEATELAEEGTELAKKGKSSFWRRGKRRGPKKLKKPGWINRIINWITRGLLFLTLGFMIITGIFCILAYFDILLSPVKDDPDVNSAYTNIIISLSLAFTTVGFVVGYYAVKYWFHLQRNHKLALQSVGTPPNKGSYPGPVDLPTGQQTGQPTPLQEIAPSTKFGFTSLDAPIMKTAKEEYHTNLVEKPEQVSIFQPVIVPEEVVPVEAAPQPLISKLQVAKTGKKTTLAALTDQISRKVEKIPTTSTSLNQAVGKILGEKDLTTAVKRQVQPYLDKGKASLQQVTKQVTDKGKASLQQVTKQVTDKASQTVKKGISQGLTYLENLF